MKDSISNTCRRAGSGLPLLVSLMCCGMAAAADVTGTVSVAVGHSNNVLRTADNQVSESMAILGAEFGLVESTRKFNADIVANFDYVTYVNDSFDNDLVGGAAALINYQFIEERLLWALQYNYGQQVFDPLVPIRPDNQENVSYLTTGPQLVLPLGDRLELGVNLSFSDVSYELSPNSQSRKTVQIRFTRLLNQGRSISLLGTTERVEYYEEIANPDFDRNGFFVRYETISSRNTISVDLGVNELALDGVSGKDSGTLVRVNWERMISSNSSFELGGGTRYSDQGDIFRFFQNSQFNDRDTEDVIGTATPFRNNFFNSSYGRRKGRTSIEAALLWSEEDYEGDDVLDRSVTRLSVLLGRELSQKVFGELGVSALSRVFEGADREDDDIQLTLTLGYEINPAFFTTISYQYFTRSTNSGATEFDENRVFLRLSYAPRWARAVSAL